MNPCLRYLLESFGDEAADGSWLFDDGSRLVPLGSCWMTALPGRDTGAVAGSLCEAVLFLSFGDCGPVRFRAAPAAKTKEVA